MVAFKPSAHMGILIMMFLWIFTSSLASSTILSACREITSAEIGPSTNLGDFGYDFFEVTAFFGNQGRIGGNAADNAQIVCCTDFVDICGINKQFHICALLY